MRARTVSITLEQLAVARLQVSANVDHSHAREAPEHERGTTQRAGADHCVLGQPMQAATALAAQENK